MSPISVFHLLLVGLVLHVTVTEGLQCYKCDNDCVSPSTETCSSGYTCGKLDGTANDVDFTLKGCTPTSWGTSNDCVDISSDDVASHFSAYGVTGGNAKFCLCDTDLCNGSVKAGISFLMVILVACALWVVKY